MGDGPPEVQARARNHARYSPGDRLRSREGVAEADRPLSRDASGLAGDYSALARELLQAIAAHESRHLAAVTRKAGV